MKKMSIEDAAKFFGVSKEAIHNRVRRGSLQSVVENGVKLVVVDERTKNVSHKRVSKAAVSQADVKYQKFLEEQNAKLQQKIDSLEKETRTLRDQKEQMLIEERQKLEAIYKEKDEQLKNILQTISSKFLLEMPAVQEEETIEAYISEESEVDNSISLKKYLKSYDLSDKKREKVKKKFEKYAKKDDERMVMIGKKIYLNPEKYDYSDLVK